MSFSNLFDNQLEIFMSEKTIISLNLAEENQNDQLIPQEFGVAIKSNLYNPQEINDIEIYEESHNLFIHINIA